MTAKPHDKKPNKNLKGILKPSIPNPPAPTVEEINQIINQAASEAAIRKYESGFEDLFDLHKI